MFRVACIALGLAFSLSSVRDGRATMQNADGYLIAENANTSTQSGPTASPIESSPDVHFYDEGSPNSGSATMSDSTNSNAAASRVEDQPGGCPGGPPCPTGKLKNRKTRKTRRHEVSPN